MDETLELLSELDSFIFLSLSLRLSVSLSLYLSLFLCLPLCLPPSTRTRAEGRATAHSRAARARPCRCRMHRTAIGGFHRVRPSVDRAGVHSDDAGAWFVSDILETNQ